MMDWMDIVVFSLAGRPVLLDFPPGEQVNPVALLPDDQPGNMIDMFPGNTDRGFLENVHHAGKIIIIFSLLAVPGLVGRPDIIVPAPAVDDFMGNQLLEDLGDESFPVDGSVYVKKCCCLFH